MNDQLPQIDPRNQTPKVFLDACETLGISNRVGYKVMAASFRGVDRDIAGWPARGIVPKKYVSLFQCESVLTLEKTTRSPIDNFQKLLFRTQDNLPIETVVIPLHKPGNVSLCLSSQVGCVMQCAFCATGRMTERKNLETREIVEQFIQARELVRRENRKVTGVVFMGMGEPFLNYNRVMAAAELLCFPAAGAISSKAITISTVGLVDEIERFTEEGRKFRLSISLGAATDEKRAAIVPIASKTPIKKVIAAARNHALKMGARVNLSYVCIAGFNVGVEDALSLAALVSDFPVRIDLIDVTDPTGRYHPPLPEELNRFRSALSQHIKQPIARRYSGGKDIQAACGTLAGIG